MKRTLALCAALASGIFLAACSPKTEPAEDAGGVPPGAAAKRIPLPDCAEVEAVDAGAEGWKHPDCRLMIPGDANLAFEARYAVAADESTLVTIQIVQPGDATIQTLSETMGNTFQGPNVQDVDGDGLVDILVPLETGNVNTDNAVWRQKADKSFVRAGELSGVTILLTAGKLIAVQARSSAAAWSVSFFRMDGDALAAVATADVTANADDAGTITSVTCTLTDEGGLSVAGFTHETGEAALCADPVVADIFR